MLIDEVTNDTPSQRLMRESKAATSPMTVATAVPTSGPRTWNLDLGKSVGNCSDSGAGDSYGDRDANTDDTSSYDIVDNGSSTGARGEHIINKHAQCAHVCLLAFVC